MSKRWEQREDAILHTFWRSRTHAHIAGLLPGRSEKAVRNRCWRLGLIERNDFTKEEVAAIRQCYAEAGDASVDLGRLAEDLGRSASSVCNKACELGLTNANRRKSKELRKAISERSRKWIRDNGHPKGMEGKSHTEDTRRRISETHKTQAALGMHHSQHRDMSDEQRDALSRAMSDRLRSGGNVYSRVRSGRRDDLGGQFFRSAWEANYARYLNFIKDHGKILSWEFEPDTFWFDNIKRGTRSYTPDFKITDENGHTYYVEVKGWMDRKSKTKLKRMKKYHPDVDLRLVGKKEYRAIERQVGASLPGWE